MTGWELTELRSELLNKRSKKIKAFLKEYPLATITRDDSTMLIIRKYHPELNWRPDDPTYPTNSYRMCLAYYTISTETYYELPDLDYTAVYMSYDQKVWPFSIIIVAKEMTRTTNISELSKKLNNFERRTEEEKKAIFAGLSNEVPEVKKKIAITQTTVQSKAIGTLRQDDFEDWWTSGEIDIPFWDNQPFTITYTDFNPNEDTMFLEEADVLLSNFLAKTSVDRLAVSGHVYRNCMDFLEAIGFNEDDEVLWNMKSEEEVWRFVKCTNLYVGREPYEDKGVYLQLVCNCDWEQEHGLQLVYNKDGKLVRVSAQDGHIMGWKGSGMITD
ncbi:hypothetical protein SAMN04488128_106411 [Chitinophaga eiseniae]|uniref:DUF6985 domain-containing protein n=1 Tax=Chitinophaga eiseniae TaxID=634771 RepID=A0A1T4TW07_9BACT|nr:hypothetical protein [Chitinophaga eiseniae]SKA44471.1 hypothetical protein SAMN04488128_106411 [Chitinophaga eiseniae]